MANNLTQLKVDIRTAFVSNLDVSSIQKLRDYFVSAYQSEWNARVATGTADTSTNRNIFASDKVMDYIRDIYQAESTKANIAAAPAGDILT